MPGREYLDFHELITTYAGLVSGHALRIDPGATPRRRRCAVPVEDGESPFHYMDTASARAGLVWLNRRLVGERVGIVGLGGTGSYVLDLVAKTPVRAIHLFDDDGFEQHNAFRSPGAASLDDLDAGRSKVDHFAAVYSRMHTGVFPHRIRLDRDNVRLLDLVDFAFVCIDDGPAKRPIIDRLERGGKSFIDVGMGVEFDQHGLFGTVRVTTSTLRMRSHVHERERIPFVGGGEPDAYATNIQIADLNALNAALAVMRWKRLRGFYADGRREHHSTFDVDGNHVINTDIGETGRG